MKLRVLSEMLGGSIIGDPDLEITGVSGIREAKNGDITFLSSLKYSKYLKESRASCILVKEELRGIPVTQLKVANPQYAYARAIEIFFPRPSVGPGIREKAFVSDTAVIGRGAAIFPFAYIGDYVTVGDGTVIFPGVYIGERTRIGSQCVLFPNVTVRENVTIGNRVTIHSGSVIGSDGFGYVFEGGEHYKIPQVGGVIIGDNVEIGSNVSVDRATLGNTVIGPGTKIDNLVQIAHNVKIGEKSLIVAQVGIAGSSEIGSYVTLAGQVGVADHTKVASGTIAVAKTGLMGDVEKGIYGGTFPIPHRDWLKAQALFAKLPEMHKKIKELEEKIKTLEKEKSA